MNGYIEWWWRLALFEIECMEWNGAHKKDEVLSGWKLECTYCIAGAYISCFDSVNNRCSPFRIVPDVAIARISVNCKNVVDVMLACPAAAQNDDTRKL